MNKFLHCLVFLSFFVKTHAQMDGPFIGERFQLYNGLVTYKVWGIGDFLIMNADSFQLKMSDVNYLKRQNFKQFEADYLFQEENYWVKRLYRTIIFKDHAVNKVLNNVVTPNGEITFKDFLKLGVHNPNLFFYKSGDFNIRLTDKNIFNESLDQIVGVQFKEDFAYNRMTNKLEVYISGVAPIIENNTNGYSPIFWLNFQNLKGELGAEECRSVLVNKLEERHFKASVDQEQNIIMKGVLDHTYQTDLDALVVLKLLEERISVTSEVYLKEGKFKVKFDQFIIKGTILNRKLEGEVVMKDKNKGVLLRVQFHDGVPNGKYTQFYSKGKIKHTGNFTKGLRTGDWLGYFENGTISTAKKYENGFLDGPQEIYFINGMLRNEYSFENGKLSGSFKGYYPGGLIKEEGEVVNGLLSGNWNYNIYLEPKFIDIVLRNPSFWSEKFKSIPECNISLIGKGEFSFTAKYEYEKDERCLNSLCPKMTILNSIK